MEDRLLKLLDTEQLSSSRFADVIGVQRSSVSHILTGRNKPSFDFLQKTLKAFPMLNADWLILGEGEMYEGEHGPGGGNLFDLPTPSSLQKEEVSGQAGEEKHIQDDTSSAPGVNISDQFGEVSEKSAPGGDVSPSRVGLPGVPEKTADVAGQPALSSRRVTRVILFYDDNSFEAYDQA